MKFVRIYFWLYIACGRNTGGDVFRGHGPPVHINAKLLADVHERPNYKCPLRGDIRKNWNDTEKISMAPAQG